ncbi:unnamed protein product [Linum trigynum]|uniref:Uncharacterized protein n=1 Tax=Linum trigynum TaxID=586398 RepID=A0AAV2F454_9ROSI
MRHNMCRLVSLCVYELPSSISHSIKIPPDIPAQCSNLTVSLLRPHPANSSSAYCPTQGSYLICGAAKQAEPQNLLS